MLYGRINLIALPFFILQYEFQCLFAAAEKPKLGLYVTLASGFTNMILDWLFVGKGSVVRNCVLMQATDVGENVTLDYVCTDKNTKISSGRTLSGSEMYTVYIRKGSVV